MIIIATKTTTIYIYNIYKHEHKNTKMIYQSTLHPTLFLFVTQLCNISALFVLRILQKRWWTWFLSTTWPRSIEDFTNFTNDQGILAVPPVDSMGVKKTTIGRSKIVEEKKHMFIFCWCKQNEHHPIYLKWLFWNCNSLIRDPLFFLNLRESRPFFVDLQEIGGCPQS